MALQGELAHTDTLQPSLRCIPVSNSKFPKALEADWVAPNAVLVGDVQLAEGSSVWHGVTMRGDKASIEVGKNSLIQDNSNVTSNDPAAGDKVTIGDNVYVGPNCRLDACSLDSFSYVGMGASIGKGAVVESYAVVAAGAQVPEGTTVPSGQIYAGSPARYLRDITQQEKHLLGEHHVEMQQLAQVYSDTTEQTFREQVEHREALLRYQFQDPQERLQEYMMEQGHPMTHEDFEYMEHRVYHECVGTLAHNKESTVYRNIERGWVPYEQDLTQYPEVFKKYQENYAKYDKVNERFENEDPWEEAGESAFTRRLPKDMSPWESKYDTVLPRYTGTSCQ